MADEGKVLREVQPYVTDDVRVAEIGTLVFFVLLVVSIIEWHYLKTHGREWWLATCACGVGLGLVGQWFLRRRRRRLGDRAGAG
ncbi:MAG TPA: DUF2530 domain-containing protein [Mycobacteriales bacterium]|nr:DUF2530 domain-containing protein [Mycobacteriales bacterium]